jgi:hypothetical protein
MRRTKAAQIYKKTGNLRAVQLLLGHTKLESVDLHLQKPILDRGAGASDRSRAAAERAVGADLEIATLDRELP